MNVSVTPQPKSTVRLTIELAVEDMKPFLERAAEILSQRHKIEGFRPGKASAGIVSQRLGQGALWEEAAELAVRKTFVEAVRDHKLKTIGAPNVSVHKLAPDNPFVFHADVAILPEVKLGEYRSVRIKPGLVNVTPEQIETALSDLREMFAKDTPIDRPAAVGDKVEVDFDLTMDGQAVEGGSSKQHPVVIGSKNFIPGFEEQLVGLTKGAKKEFSLTFPANYGNKMLAGKPGTFRVMAHNVFAIDRPEVNDAFAQQAGKFKTVAELRENIEKSLRDEAAQEVDAEHERRLVEELIKRSTFPELPELIVNAELDKMLRELKEEVERRGPGSFTDYLQSIKKSEDELKKEFQPRAEQRVKAALILRAVSQAESITATPEEIQTEIESALKTYAQYPEYRKQIDTEDYRDFVKVMLTNKKVVAQLRAWAGAAK